MFGRSKQDQFLEYVNSVVTAQRNFDACFEELTLVLEDSEATADTLDAVNKKSEDALESYNNAQAMLSTFILVNKDSIHFD